jgi:hypothetical protein
MNADDDNNAPVCDNQATFNVALRKGIKYNNEKTMDDMSSMMLVYSILYLIFFVWAVMIVLKTVPKGAIRTQHLLFAMVASPVYVISYYVNKHAGEGSSV